MDQDKKGKKEEKRELVYNAKHLELALLRVGWWSRWVLLS
jgi:hypothetical protein